MGIYIATPYRLTIKEILQRLLLTIGIIVILLEAVITEGKIQLRDPLFILAFIVMALVIAKIVFQAEIIIG
jgi:phosphoglycerol transferase MdoB-like AlkP superfamily enzyme